MIFYKDTQYYKFCAYGLLKNFRLYEPFIVLYFLSLSLSYFQIGLLYAIREVVRNLLEIPSGVIADMLGRRRTLASAFGVYALSFVLFSLSNNFATLAGSMFLFAIADAFRTGTHKAMIFSYLQAHNWGNLRGSYYGLTRSWSQLGTALSALLSAIFVLFVHELRFVFLLSALPALSDMSLLLSYPKWLEGEIISLQYKNIANTFRKHLSQTFKTIKQPNTFRAIMNLSIFSGAYRGLKDFIQPLIQHYALAIPIILSLNAHERTSIVTGLVYFFLFLVSSQASRVSGGFEKIFHTAPRAMNISFIIAALSIGLSGIFVFAGMYGFGIAGFMLIFLIENIRNPIGTAYVSSRFSNQILSTALSANSQIKSLTAAVIAPLFGYIADQFDLAAALCFSGIFLLLSALITRLPASLHN